MKANTGNGYAQTDYYAFGMVMPGREYYTGRYRFGYNGKEKDDEVKGTENQQDYGFRIYDTRLGKFSSVDPLTSKFVFYSPYQFAGNRPIVAIDLDGLEDVWNHTIQNADGSISTMTIFKGDDNYVATRIAFAQELGIDVNKLPNTGALNTYGEQKENGGSLTNIQYTYQPQVVVVASRSFWHVMSDFGAEMDQRYYGDKGFKQLGNDLSDGGLMVQVAGYGTTLVGAPEIGLPMIAVGRGMGATGEVAEIASNVNEGDYGAAAKNTALALGKAALGNFISGKIISGTGVTGEVSKKIIETNIDLKIEGTQKLIEKVVDDCNTNEKNK